jgi:hypothetical protein
MANPNNILNQNLVIGGNLGVVGNLALTGNAAIVGNLALTGNAAIVGNVVTTGLIASGTSLGLVTPTLGTFSLDFTEVLVTLNTAGATTSINFGTNGLPGGASAVAASIRVVTAITGINSTTGTLNLNPTSTSGPSPAGSISAFTAGTTESGISPSGISIDSADADDGEFVLSGGGDNIPSAGSIQVTVYFWRVTGSTS